MSGYFFGRMKAILDQVDVLTSTRAPASTALTDATWTDAKAAFLDKKISEAGSSPPILISGHPMVKRNVGADADTWHNYIGGETGLRLADNIASGAFNVWTNLFSYTGSGCIKLLYVEQETNPSSRDMDLRVLIDGTAVMSANALFTVTGDDGDKVMMIGDSWADRDLGDATQLAILTFDSVFFNTSFAVEVRKSEDDTGNGTFDVFGIYHKYT